MRNNVRGRVAWFVNVTRGWNTCTMHQLLLCHIFVIWIPWSRNSLVFYDSVLSAAPPRPRPLLRARSLSSTLCDSQWGSASNRVDPSRAPLWLVPLPPSSSSVLACLIPHSLSKGQSLGCLLRMLTLEPERWDKEREREKEGDRCSYGRQPPTDFESWVNKCPVYLGQGALTLAIRHACIKP